MNALLEKAKSFVMDKLKIIPLPKIPTVKSKASMLVIIAYLFIISFVVLLRIVAQIHKWTVMNQLDIGELRDLFNDVIDPRFSAVVVLLALYLKDSDNDGVPDEIEKEHEQ